MTAPRPGPHMGAIYNQLYESGTRDDLLSALARSIARNRELRERIRYLEIANNTLATESAARADELRDVRERERLRDGGWS